MNLDEFAFVNQQLSGMLKSGIPLEGALRRLCTEMRRGTLRSELEALGADSARGTPLRQALAARRLPSFYVQMLEIGAESNDLPAVLSLLADYYGRVHIAWTRLKGLLVYPLIVPGASFAVSVLLAIVYQALLAECSSSLGETGDVFIAGSPHMPAPFWLGLNLWLPVILIGSLCVLAVLAVAVPAWRRALRWRFPAFRESSLSQLAAALALLLERGCHLDRALGLVQQLEAGSPIAHEVAQWQTRLASGHKEFSGLAAGGKVVPPLFVWLVAGSGEDWAGGFKQAAKVYYERAIHQVEVLLYAALPVSVLALGLLIVAQVLPMVRLFAGLMRSLVSDCGMGE